jgi:hypothetical protein
MSIDAKMMRRDAPFGKEDANSWLQSGMIADVAPSKVMRPRISVIRFVALLVIRVPTAIPIEDPAMIARILMIVPSPINIPQL